jgi:AcrR family transcriptional regulator
MTKIMLPALESRKTPIQARSTATVDAIFEATIQVLLRDGDERLTTTRVAERAGVSVGTLYQYYPNKQALLFAILEGHMNKVTEAVETTCRLARGKPLAEMIQDIVEAFVDAKMERTDISTALYRIAADVDGPALVQQMARRSQKALKAALLTAPDMVLGQENFVVQMLFSAMTGTTRSVLEAGASPGMVQNLRDHLKLLCQSYLTAATQTSARH